MTAVLGLLLQLSFNNALDFYMCFTEGRVITHMVAHSRSYSVEVMPE